MENDFSINLQEVEKPIYDHGYSEQEVDELKLKFKEISSRDLYTFPVTLEETRLIIIPYRRITRTETFTLIKEKEKAKKEKKAETATKTKVKKLTKKEQQKLFIVIVQKIQNGEEVTEEEQELYNKLTNIF